MARLFAKDYHERSNSWFFNHAVIVFEEGDLWHYTLRMNQEISSCALSHGRKAFAFQ